MEIGIKFSVKMLLESLILILHRITKNFYLLPFNMIDNG
jgi:hypothetical protein